MKYTMTIVLFCAAVISVPLASASGSLTVYSYNGMIYANAYVDSDGEDGYASVDMYIDGPGSHDSPGEYQCTYYTSSSYQNLLAQPVGMYVSRAWVEILEEAAHWLLENSESWIERIRYSLSSSMGADPCTFTKSCFPSVTSCSGFQTVSTPNTGGACTTNYYKFVTAVDIGGITTKFYNIGIDEPDDIEANSNAFPCGRVE